MSHKLLLINWIFSFISPFLSKTIRSICPTPHKVTQSCYICVQRVINFHKLLAIMQICTEVNNIIESCVFTDKWYVNMRIHIVQTIRLSADILCMGVLCNFYAVGTGSLHLHTSRKFSTLISYSTTQNTEKIKSSKKEVKSLGASSS